MIFLTALHSNFDFEVFHLSSSDLSMKSKRRMLVTSAKDQSAMGVYSSSDFPIVEVEAVDRFRYP